MKLTCHTNCGWSWRNHASWCKINELIKIISNADLFHLIQNCRRKILELRLIGEYTNKNCESDICLWKLFNHSSLNPNKVFFSDSFVISFNYFNDSKMLKCCDYLIINNIIKCSRFNLNIWDSPSITTKRTTNTCKFFLSKLNILRKSRPYIYLFIHMLNTKIQRDTYIILSPNLLKDYENKIINRLRFICLALSHYKKIKKIHSKF